jgi:hypothetical protein
VNACAREAGAKRTREWTAAGEIVTRVGALPQVRVALAPCPSTIALGWAQIDAAGIRARILKTLES